VSVVKSSHCGLAERLAYSGAAASRLSSAAFYRVPDNYGNTNGLAIVNEDI
jgi:hypothetical protein